MSASRGPARYKPRGALALMPDAFDEVFDLDASGSEVASPSPSVALIAVRGPLMHHASFWFDSYDAIKARVAVALAERPRAVVLAFDTPGGTVGGLFEAADEIAAMCSRAKVPVHAYVDGCAASAGYALASICETITVPRTGIVGSVGVVAAMVDASENLAQAGIKVRLVTSGARKGDGDPSQPATDEAVAALQAQVDTLATIFFEHVSARRGMSVEAVRGMEAAIYTGAEAVAAGLADQVGTLEQLVASIAAGSAPAKAQKVATMEENETKAREALQAILDDEKADESAKGKAKRALAAMDGEEDVEKDDTEKPADEEASARVASLTAINAALELELAALRAAQPSEADRKEAEACSAVDRAIGEGRIAASARDAWLASARASLSGFEAVVGKFPALTHRVTSSTPSKGTPAPKSTDVKVGGSKDEADAKALLERNGHKSAATRVGA